MTERDYNMKVFVPTLREVVKSYEIKYDKKNPIPFDSDSANNLFKAAVEFLSKVGVYCKDTNRVIQFSKEEILEAVKQAPGKCFLGEGKDAGVCGTRTPDDPKTPWFNVGWSWICTTEEIATNQIEVLASIPGTNSIGICAINNIRGIQVVAGSPGEIYAAIRCIRIAREATRRAGRPGMPIMNCIGTASAAVTTIAASAPQFGLRPSDGWVVGIISELTVDFGIMNKVAYLLNWGANIGAESGPILGGFCGGAAGTAVVSTACVLMGLLVHKGSYHLAFPMDSRHGSTTTRDILWVVSSACQAVSRNISVPVNWLGYTAAGPNTKMYFYEAAAYILCSITSGAAIMGIPHPSRGVKIDGSTPMEAIFGVEMGKGVCKLNREKANELVLRLLEKYEVQIPTAPEGDRYQDCYDVITGKPGEGYARLYNEVKEELLGMGIPFG